MLELTDDEVENLKGINAMIGVFEPIYNHKYELTDFKIKFINSELFVELNHENFVDRDMCDFNLDPYNILKEKVVKFGFRTTIDNIDIAGKSYILHCSEFKDKLLLCSFYKNREANIKESNRVFTQLRDTSSTNEISKYATMFSVNGYSTTSDEWI